MWMNVIRSLLTRFPNSPQEFQEAISQENLTVIDCYATWCGPCKVISPVLDRLSESPDFAKVGFFKFDVDALPNLAQENGIRAMPTFLYFKNGEKIKEVVGANPPALEATIRANIN
jgi:thioredoxin 1